MYFYSFITENKWKKVQIVEGSYPEISYFNSLHCMQRITRAFKYSLSLISYKLNRP